MKKIIKIALLIIVIVAILLIVISCLGVKVSGRCEIYVEDYKEFYLYCKNTVSASFLNIDNSASGPAYKIWFWPGQKRKMLEKINDDIIVTLNEAKDNNDDIIKSYKISDNLKSVTIYYAKNAWNYKDNPEQAKRMSDLADFLSKTVEYRVELYWQIKDSYMVEFTENILNFVEE